MKRFITLLSIVQCSMFNVQLCEAQIIHVPADQPTIQAGIDAAATGDTVLVAEGTYLENISFNGKAITVASYFIMDGDTNHINNTVIDGSQPANPDYGSVVTFITGEDTTSVLCGFTITGGTGMYIPSTLNFRFGGGIVCNFAGATIQHNKIVNNTVTHDSYAFGGGIGAYSSSGQYWLIVRDNVIAGNSVTAAGGSAFGGGLYSGINLDCSGNLVYSNTCTGTGTAHASGAGIEVEDEQGNTIEFEIRDNEVHSNSAEGYWAYGIGIMVFGAAGSVAGNVIHDNSGTSPANAMGGGLRFLNVPGEIYIMNNHIYNNSLDSDRPQGAGIDIGLATSNTYIEDNLIEQNSMTATYACWGGAINMVQDGEIFISGNQVIGNTVHGDQWSCGAGIWNEGATGKAEFRHNVFQDNEGEGTGYGGGLGFYNSNQVDLEIEGNMFRNNLMGSGGGLWTFNSYNMLVYNNVFQHNTASSGGSAQGGAVRMRHAAARNEDGPSVGFRREMQLQAPSPAQRMGVIHPLIINNTFVSNEAATGGGIYCDHQAEFPLIVNSLFFENEANAGDEIYYTGQDSLLLSFCNIDPTSISDIFGKWKGTNNIWADPGFCEDSCHIYEYSYCVDAGTESIEFDGTWYFAPDVDFEGTPRPYGGGGFDIGADECDIFTSVSKPTDLTQQSTLKIITYPNPTKGIFNLQFTIYNLQSVSMKIYDLHGREVALVVDEKLPAGEHMVPFDATDFPNGIYLICLKAGNEVMTGKVIKQ